MSHKYTHEEYLKLLEEKRSVIEPLEKYNGLSVPILHHCKIHNVNYITSPACVLRGNGCSKCRADKIRQKRGKTTEQYIAELKIKNPNIIPIEPYQSTHVPILHKCLIHDVIWEIEPNAVLSGCGCSKCRSKKITNTKTLTHEQYLENLNIVNKNIIPLEKYKGSHNKILHRCLIHNIEWATTPNSILSGKECPKCAMQKIKDKLSKDNEVYVSEIKDKNIIALEPYINCRKKILHKCLICDYEWEVSPQCVLRGYGCPQCHQSAGENKIAIWLSSYNINYTTQKRFNDCVDIKPLPFDFYLPDYNKCIEFDGEQHFKAKEFFGGQEGLEYTQRHDQIKNEYCAKNNIPLLRIPYYANVEEELEKFLA